MTPLEGKVGIVTGASRGIGLAIAQALARDGAHVLMVARSAEALEMRAAEIRARHGRADVHAVDLREPDAAAAVVTAAYAIAGRVDILVNNAGATRRGAFLSLSDEDWQDGFALKLFGAVRLCRAAWPHLVANAGSVVNIAGVGGRTPGALFAVGGSVNGALLTFTKSLAETGLADGVQVNAINPGSVRTDRLRKRLEDLARERGVDLAGAEQAFVARERVTRVGEPEDIAALVSFVVGPHGRFLHGASIDMDGGATKAL